ncbi:hypothetical protein L1887_07480 [Cichorium endivia]|nr:hypothetical protein L1887_07480 [Cichorium endivia]
MKKGVGWFLNEVNRKIGTSTAAMEAMKMMKLFALMLVMMTMATSAVSAANAPAPAPGPANDATTVFVPTAIASLTALVVAFLF